MRGTSRLAEARAPCRRRSSRRWRAPHQTSCRSCGRSACRSAHWRSTRKPSAPKRSRRSSRRFASTIGCAGPTSRKPPSSGRSTCHPRSIAPSNHASPRGRGVCQHARNPPDGMMCSQGMDSCRVCLSNLSEMDRAAMEGIQIYELKRMDLRGATVIDGFPSVGLVSSIVANYLINALNLTQIGIMDSIYFPTVALVRDGQPMNPVRIYAGPKVDDRDQIVVFISEFQPPPNLIKAIAATVLDWAQDARCNLLVCPEGLIVDAREDEGERQVEVYGIGSTDKAMDMIRKNGITVFEEGVITGVAGVLLNEGRKRDFDVITLLSEAHPDYPDARAAARAIEIIDKLLLHTELDARPLYEEAERIEMQLKSIHHQTEAAKKPTEPARPNMYG